MKFSVDKQEAYTILKLEEEKLDSTLAPNIKSEFVTLHAEGVSNLIVDLSSVKYCDSSGLSALLVGNRTFSENGGAFIITQLNEFVKKLITISQLDAVLSIVDTLEEGTAMATQRAQENSAGE